VIIGAKRTASTSRKRKEIEAQGRPARGAATGNLR